MLTLARPLRSELPDSQSDTRARDLSAALLGHPTLQVSCRVPLGKWSAASYEHLHGRREAARVAAPMSAEFRCCQPSLPLGPATPVICIQRVNAASPPCPFPVPQQVNLVAVAGRGLHLSIPTMRFLLALQSSLQPRLRLELIESWDNGALLVGCAS